MKIKYIRLLIDGVFQAILCFLVGIYALSSFANYSVLKDLVIVLIVDMLSAVCYWVVVKKNEYKHQCCD